MRIRDVFVSELWCLELKLVHLILDKKMHPTVRMGLKCLVFGCSSPVLTGFEAYVIRSGVY